MKQWRPVDIITLVLLIGAIILRGLGIDSVVEYILLAIAAGYLGLSLANFSVRRKPHG